MADMQLIKNVAEKKFAAWVEYVQAMRRLQSSNYSDQQEMRVIDSANEKLNSENRLLDQLLDELNPSEYEEAMIILGKKCKEADKQLSRG